MFPTMLVLMLAAHGQHGQPEDTALKNTSELQKALQVLHAHGNASSLPCALENIPSSPAKAGASPGCSAAAHKEMLASPQSYLPLAALTARQFLTHLLRNNWEALLELTAFPFWLESQTYPSAQALREAWETPLSQKHLGSYEIGGIEVLTLAQMRERFGPPPERLHKLLQGRNTHFFAVANVSGRAVVLMLQPPSRDSGFKVVAFHD